jgi:hypothetical protein
MSGTKLILARSVQGLKIQPGDPHADTLFRIPSHSMLTVLGPHQRDGMVEVEWQGGLYAVFATDLEERSRNSQMHH